MPAKLSPRDIDNLVSRYHGGEKVQHLAGEVGLTPTTLYVKFHQRGAQTIRKIALDTEHIIERYRAGETIDALAAEYSVSAHVIYDRLHERGVHVTREIPIDVDMAISAYAAGASMNSLANQFGVSRTVLQQRFRKRGVEIRGRSDAERLKWRALLSDRSAVERQLGKAWEAALGREQTIEERSLRARTRMKRLRHRGLYEDDLTSLLLQRGLDPVQQYAIDNYNVDIALPVLRIAVEVFSGAWGDAVLSSRRDRVEHILDRGWHMLMLLIAARHKANRSIDLSSAADQVVAFTQTVRRLHTTRGKYRMVRGDGQRVTLLGHDPNDRALI